MVLKSSRSINPVKIHGVYVIIYSVCTFVCVSMWSCVCMRMCVFVCVCTRVCDRKWQTLYAYHTGIILILRVRRQQRRGRDIRLLVYHGNLYPASGRTVERLYYYYYTLYGMFGKSVNGGTYVPFNNMCYHYYSRGCTSIKRRNTIWPSAFKIIHAYNTNLQYGHYC